MPAGAEPSSGGVPALPYRCADHPGPGEAAFALIADAAACPDFASFAQGTPAYPDRSATLVLAVTDLSNEGWRLDGPGIRGSARLSASPLPADILPRLARNHAGFRKGST